MMKRSIYIDEDIKKDITKIAESYKVTDSDIIREFLKFGIYAVKLMEENNIPVTKSNEIFKEGINIIKRDGV